MAPNKEDVTVLDEMREIVPGYAPVFGGPDVEGFYYEVMGERDVEALETSISHQLDVREIKPDNILMMLRGGRRLGGTMFEKYGARVGTARLRRFHGTNDGREIEVLHEPDIDLSSGVTMVTEDVVDAGLTLGFARKNWLTDSAVVVSLTQKNNSLGEQADVFGAVSDRWVHFPWEDTELFVDKIYKNSEWLAHPLEERLAMLAGLGFGRERLAKGLGRSNRIRIVSTMDDAGLPITDMMFDELFGEVENQFGGV